MRETPSASNESCVAVWTAAQRESFFEAIARNRRAAIRVTVVAWLCGALFTAVFAVLMSPLLIGLIVLAIDAANFAHPLPDPVALATAWARAAAHGGTTLSPIQWAEGLAVLSLPGIVLVALAMLLLRRALSRCITLEATGTPTRPADPSRIAEQRLVNVAAEMAVAAQVPAPEVRIAASPYPNALILGTDRSRLTIVATQGLLDRFDRNALEGTVAHLIASAANGDLRIAQRFSVDVVATAILMRPPGSGRPLHALARLGQAVIRPQLMEAAALREWLAPRRNAATGTLPSSPSGLRERLESLFTLVLMGPWMAGFFLNVACAFLIMPLLALAWRQRKYLADATAVRLTRDPDALAGALEGFKGGDAPLRGADPTALMMAHLDRHPEDAARVKALLDGTAADLMRELPAAAKAYPGVAAAIESARHHRDELAAALEARARSDPRVEAALQAASHSNEEDRIRIGDETFAPAWQAPMAAFQRAGAETMGLAVDPVPGARPRLKRLARLGAHLHQPPRRASPAFRLLIAAIATPVALLMAAVVALSAYVSAAMSGIFTLIPLLLLHGLLRWLAGH